MELIPLHVLGTEENLNHDSTRWDELGLGTPWQEVVDAIAPGSSPSDVQIRAIRDGQLLSSRRNVVVAGPTNSGKSLLAYFALLRGVLGGGRVLLLEPLRVIAQEKRDELEVLTEELRPILGRKIDVTITTGDYRLDEETMQSPPPDTGEVVIATPERIEAILRNPDFDRWISSFRVVCVDEAHLIADPVRGASLEYVVTSFRVQSSPPRLVLLSATLGDPDPLVRWLEPCDSVSSNLRQPPLHRTLCKLEAGEDVGQEITRMVREILENPEHSVLIFVYQTSWATALAERLKSELGRLCGPDGAVAYHSRLSSATRTQIRKQVQSGETRCVVSTAALAMGVNLPSTHVIVRDLAYGPNQPLSTSALHQMTGRAGRGRRAGQALLILKDTDPRDPFELRRELEAGSLPALRSVFSQPVDGRERSISEPPLAKTVLSLLARRPDHRLPTSEVERFISNTLNGPEVTAQSLPALRWLGSPANVLAFEDGGEWSSTRLGQAAMRGSLPLPIAAGLGQLVRDLLSIDESDAVIRQLSPLDLLLLGELLTTRPVLRKPFSEGMADQVDEWASRNEVKSVLFKNWIRGKKGFSNAAELLGSLGLSITHRSGPEGEVARKVAYQAMLRTIVLWQRAHGALASDLERRWKLVDLDEILESWRDDRLFLLGAMRNLWDIRCFFFHLKQECDASDERIFRVKRALQRLQAMSLRLMSLVAWCSPLGPVFLRLRNSTSATGSRSPALATIHRLEAAGIRDVEALRGCSTEDLLNIGVRRELAVKIQNFLRR